MPLMPTYARAPVAFTHGQGARLHAEDGRTFIDFGAGIATSSLGHAHPGLTAAIATQAARLIHVSNLYRIPGAERLADRLTAAAFPTTPAAAFFCNSGAEANEGAAKLIRRAMATTGHPERYRILCFHGAFHGRTLAMLSATGNAKYLTDFGPEVDGFDHVPFGNMNAVRDAIGPHTAGILVEPIQGEGGMRTAPPRFLQELREACNEFGLLLAVDEVQCGMGRTGKLFAHQWAGITPDIITTAKGIAGGFPMGAILATNEVARHLTPGSHASTFGGSPLACAAANAVLDVILAPGFLQSVTAHGATLRQGIETIAAAHPTILGAVRGTGLMLGVECHVPNTELQAACLDAGLLTVAAGENVLRLVPPLVLTDEEITEGLKRLETAVEGKGSALDPLGAEPPDPHHVVTVSKGPRPVVGSRGEALGLPS